MNLLFDTPLIEGLRYEEDVISEADERALLAKLELLDLAPFRFHGFLGNRRTQSFGWRYDFEDASFTPAEPIPEWLAPLRSRAAAFAGLPPEAFVHVLLARYDPGAGIGWHRDRDVFEEVVGFSLNTPATLRFRQRTGTGFRRANLKVEPRSAYLLAGEARHEWEHSITPGAQLRFSITFRALSAKGRRFAERGWRNAAPRWRFSRHVAPDLVPPAACRLHKQRPGSRPPVHQAGAFARCRMGDDQPAGGGGQADPGLCR